MAIDAAPFSAIVYMITGFYVALIGYSDFHPNKYMKKIYYLLLGYVLGVFVVFQFQIYANPDEAVEWAMLVLIPLAPAVVIGVFYPVGNLLAGAYLALILAEILSAGLHHSYPSWAPEVMVVEAIGFIGAIITIVAARLKIKFFVRYVQTCVGISFVLEGLACYVDGIQIVRPLTNQVVNSSNCTLPADTIGDMTIFLIVVFAGAFVCCFWHMALAIIIARVMAKKKPVAKETAANKWTISRSKREETEEDRRKKLPVWNFVRHREEYLPLFRHSDVLDQRLDDLGLQHRHGIIIDPDSNSLFAAIADQFFRVRHKVKRPADIRETAINWLEKEENWAFLKELEDDPFEMRGLKRKDYCDKMRLPTARGDPICIQALVQSFKIPITVVSSISGNQYITEFDYYRDKLEAEKKKIVVRGYDGNDIVVSKSIAMRIPKLKELIEEAEDESRNVIELNQYPFLNSSVLGWIFEEIKATGTLTVKTTAHSKNVQECVGWLGLTHMDHFGKPVTMNLQYSRTNPNYSDTLLYQQYSRDPMTISYLWGYFYGSVEASEKAKVKLTELEDDDPRMFRFERPAGRTVLNRILQICIILLGAWWITWMCVWGYKFSTVGDGISYMLFLIAESVNYCLGVIYNFNFWAPIYRRWKSLDKLTPKFNLKPIVNCLIFHYSEDPFDTERTLAGSLRMKTTEGMILRIYVCDDGFWRKASPPQQKVEEVRETFWEKMIRNCKGIPKPKPAPAKVPASVANWKPTTNYKASYPNEADYINYIMEHYSFIPNTSRKGAKDMLTMVKRAMYRYYTEVVHDNRVVINCEVTLKTDDDNPAFAPIIRGDCARALLSYRFYAEHMGLKIDDLQLCGGPEVYLVARVKPPVHHYKAGNVNNCIYNEGLQGEFVIFLDNDMKPKSDFITRTVPWFYYFHEMDGEYRINKGVSFIQTPQFFKDNTIATDHDFLGGRNGIFFQGIQQGRDGYDLCAFAGTNAIFRLPPLHTIKGFPYGSLTEDAHCAIHLHRFGYRSIYVEDKLSVGVAPVTVANSIQQRSRWVKGSVQIFLRAVKPGPQPTFIKFNKDDPYPGETREEIRPFLVAASEMATHHFFRVDYMIDTMMYPFSAVTAILYMVVAFIFLIGGAAPLEFERPPFRYRAFLITFVPYFICRFLSNYLSYNKVSADDVWVAEEIWYSYSFASLYGIIDAFKEEFTGTGIGGWGVTGEGKRTGNLEWANVLVVFGLLILIIIRFGFFLFAAANLIYIAAMFFGGGIVIHMWPIVSTTLYEYLYNNHLPADEKVDLRRFEVPAYIMFAAVIVVSVLLSQFAYPQFSTSYTA